MKRIFGYLKNYRIQAIMAPLFKMLEATFELLVPLVMASLIDKGIRMNDKGHIFSMGMMLVLLSLVGLAASITAQFFAAYAAMNLGKEVRADLFRKINTFSFSEIDKIGTSTLVTRMTSDVNTIQTGINMLLRLFLRSPFIIIGAVIMAFVVDVKSGIIFLVVLPILTLVSFGIIFKSIPGYKNVQGKLDKVTLLTRESIYGVRVVRAFNRQERENKAFQSATGELMEKQTKVGHLSAALNPVTYLIVNVGIAVLIYYGAIRVDVGGLSQGQVVALVNYMSQILIELIKLANLIISTTKAFASANRVDDILNTESSQSFVEKVMATSADTKHRVEMRGASLTYQGSKEASVENVTFTADPGQVIGIIGGTGSGKSSLINLIPRFYDSSAGDVFVDGVNVKDYPKKELRQKIGYVPQKAVLFSGSIEDNMKWGKMDATEEEIHQALSIAQGEEFVSKLDKGIKSTLNQGGKNLSGGQRQRLTIARALTRKPEILILDDSFSALDFATDKKLRQALHDNTNDMTVFIVTQRASTIRQADKIIVLDDGQVAGIGTHHELIDSCPVYQEICLSQMTREEAYRA